MTNIKKRDVIITMLVAGLVYMLNQRTAIYQCAAIFTAILFIVNTRLLSGTASSAYKTLIGAMALSIPLYLYSIAGTAFSVQMTAISLISLLVSGCVSIYITNTLSNKYSFPVSLFMALLVVAMIDGLIMKSYFTAFEVFSLEKIGSIFGRELLFKICYAFVVSIITYAIGTYSSQEGVKD
ncbi:MAG: hypothetical protein AAF673_01925 [Pseudomonadota bacterium]